jgi:site-specific recombinase XerD
MLANERRVAAATHRQALSALLFLYREVLGIDIPWLQQLGRPVPHKRIPVVLTHVEVQALLAQMSASKTALLAQLLYGTGMRLLEGVRLRVKDVDLVCQVIVGRDGKGGKDRVVMLPRALEAPLRAQLQHAHRLWQDDRDHGRGGVTPSRRRCTRCAIRSPPTCSRPAPTSAPCSSCSATPTSAPP